jgi:outer membrane receptor protein involved in Fe transport
VYEGLYNELDQPQFITFNAHIGYRLKDWEVSLNGTNLTNVYDQRFTTTNGGLLYGAIGAPITTDAYALQGTALMATITRRL